jgi:hypothetical protein
VLINSNIGANLQKQVQKNFNWPKPDLRICSFVTSQQQVEFF